MRLNLLIQIRKSQSLRKKTGISEKKTVKRKPGRPKKVKVETPDELPPDDLPANIRTEDSVVHSNSILRTSGNRKRIDTGPRVNNFKDDKTVAPDEIIENRKVPQGKKRPPVQLITKRCSLCRKKETVEPSLAARSLTPRYKMRYLCNACSTGKGGEGDEIYEEEDDN
jgi:hypothetical protein